MAYRPKRILVLAPVHFDLIGTRLGQDLDWGFGDWGGLGWTGVVAHEILVSAQGPLVLGFWAKVLGPGLDNWFSSVIGSCLPDWCCAKYRLIKSDNVR